MNKALHKLGEYVLLMQKAITIPDRWSMFFKQLLKEIYKLGFDSPLDCHHYLYIYRNRNRNTNILKHQLAAYPKIHHWIYDPRNYLA